MRYIYIFIFLIFSSSLFGQFTHTPNANELIIVNRTSCPWQVQVLDKDDINIEHINYILNPDMELTVYSPEPNTTAIVVLTIQNCICECGESAVIPVRRIKGDQGSGEQIFYMTTGSGFTILPPPCIKI